MLTLTDISLQFAGDLLYKHVDLIFQPDHCYGIIGANGAGKSTLLRIISGELAPTTGSVSMRKEDRMSVLEQDHFKYDAYPVMDTVIMGNRRLYDIMKEKDALYAKPDFSDADGERAAELEGEFAEMNGWDAETEAAQLLNGIGIPTELHYAQMASLDGRQKVKVLLAQALFGHPNIILLDEPTNGLDVESHRLAGGLSGGLSTAPSSSSAMTATSSTPCAPTSWTSTTTRCKMYAGNYDFWYESSQLMQQLIRNQNKKNEEKIKELQEFIRALLRQQVQDPSRPPAARRCWIPSQLEEMPASSRKYPFVGFEPEREAGKDILFVEGITKTIDGVKVLDNVSFTVEQGRQDRLCGRQRGGRRPRCSSILMGEMEPDEGSFKWGVTISQSYFPKDNTRFFEGFDEHLIDWLAPVLRGHHRNLPARLPGPDALFRRRGLQARQGALRRREGALHAQPHDDDPAPTS